MTQIELDTHRVVLEAKQAELAQLVRNRDAIAIEKSPDAIDAVQYATERELAVRNLDRGYILFRKVRAALRRMEEGSFGACLRCEEDITAKRLAVLPWAAFCISCQEIADRSQDDHTADLDWLVKAA